MRHSVSFGVEGDDVEGHQSTCNAQAEDVECGDIGRHRRAAGVFGWREASTDGVSIGAILRKVPRRVASWVKPSYGDFAAPCRLFGTQ